jgi:hypothetical protein
MTYPSDPPAPAAEAKSTVEAAIAARAKLLADRLWHTPIYDRFGDMLTFITEALRAERERALEEAEKAVRALNDPMENRGYMYEIAADVIASLKASR